MIEIWKTIEEFENYQVSSCGRIKRLQHKIKNGETSFRMVPELIMKPYIDFDGYEIIGLIKESGSNPKGFRVHRLVAEAFIPNIYNLPEINHIDGDKRNNCVENLEWINHLNNVRHANKLNLRNNSGLAIKCCETGEQFKSIAEAARYYCVSEDVISMLVHKESKNSRKLPNLHFEFI